MNPRILIVVLSLSTLLVAQEGPKWRVVEKERRDQDSSELSVFKEWRELSRAALEADKKDPRKAEVVRSFNRNANESSSTVDCGVVCSLPKIGIQIEAKIHYFFEGHVVPTDLGDRITVTFNITGAGSERKGYFVISNLDPGFITRKQNEFSPKTDGIGSLEDAAWSYSLLAIVEEADCRRLLAEEFANVNLGPLVITRADLIQQGMKALMGDLGARREEASGK